MERLIAFNQEGALADYCNTFQRLFDQVRNCEEISEFYGIYLFICGLEPEIREIIVDWHQYSCIKVENVISLALKIDSNGLQDSFSPFDSNSSFYNKDLEFDVNITLEELMKDNEFFRKGMIQENIIDEVINDTDLEQRTDVKDSIEEYGNINSAYKVFDEMSEPIRDELEAQFSDIYTCETFLSKKSEQKVVIHEISEYQKDVTLIVTNDVIVEMNDSKNFVSKNFRNEIGKLNPEIVMEVSHGEVLDIHSFRDIVCVGDFWGQKSLKEGVLGMEMVMESFEWKPGLWCSSMGKMRKELKNGWKDGEVVVIKNDMILVGFNGLKLDEQQELELVMSESYIETIRIRGRGLFGLLTVKEMHQQIREWLDLSLNQPVPSSLSILSRVFSISVLPSEDPLADREKASNVTKINVVLTENRGETLFLALSKAGGKAFSNMVVGYNKVDDDATTKYSVAAGNTLGVHTVTTTELVASLSLVASRRVIEVDEFMRAGLYNGWLSHLFVGKIGVIFGNLLISFYSKCGHMEDILLVCNKLQDLPFDPEIGFWKTLHGGFHNIWMDRKPVRLMIVDFGLTRAATLPTKKYTRKVLTFWYRAPEVLVGVPVDSNCYSNKALWSFMVWVVQEPGLLSESVKEKIAHSKKNASEFEIIHAVSLVNVNDLKDGYDTVCGETRTQLSFEYSRDLQCKMIVLKQGVQKSGNTILYLGFEYRKTEVKEFIRSCHQTGDNIPSEIIMSLMYQLGKSMLCMKSIISLIYARVSDYQLGPLRIHWKVAALDEEVELDTYISENMIEESTVELKDNQCQLSKAAVDNATQRRSDQLLVDSASNIEIIVANANVFDHGEIEVVESQFMGFLMTSKLMFCGKSDGAYLQTRHSAFRNERAEPGSETNAFNLHSSELPNKRGTRIQNLHSSRSPNKKGIRIQKHLKDWFWLFFELHKGNCEVASLDDVERGSQPLIFEDKNLIRGKYCYISKYSLAISVINNIRGTGSIKLGR